MYNAHTRYLDKTPCRECRNKHISEKLRGSNSPCYGKHLSEKTIQKLVELNTGSNNPRFGKHNSERHKQLVSEKLKGLNSPCFGKTMNDEFKRKCRVRTLERFNKLGIASCVDEGAAEWFGNLIRDGHKIIQNFQLSEIGYVVDGYDPEKHVIIEYDTPYHFTLKQRNKDAVRQRNIIRYYEAKNNPLNMFVRVRASKDGLPKMTVAYSSSSNPSDKSIPYSETMRKKQILHG
jgi:hypothetical protein